MTRFDDAVGVLCWLLLGGTAPTAHLMAVFGVSRGAWFAVPQWDGQAQEKGHPKGRPNFNKHTGGIPFAQVKQLMRFRTGAHDLWVKTGRWLKPRLSRSLRVCQKCMWGSTVEDEYHVLFEWPAYHCIRLKYENALFSIYGGVSRGC